MNVQLKIGLDIHGVIDRKPEMFAELSRTMVKAGHEVHILTGSSIDEMLKVELISYGMEWTHLFSITDHLRETGAPISHYEEGRPCFDNRIWNKAKAEYCKKHSIHLHLDDTLDYAKHFREPTFFGYFPRLGK